MFSLEFEYALGKPEAVAAFRQQAEDFCVDEALGFEPCGEGEHVYLHVQKTHTNTEWLAKQVAQFCGVQKRDVGFCGLKDRHAVTRQWFSIYMPKPIPLDWQQWASELAPNVVVLSHSRHTKKLRRGEHANNQFKIALHLLKGDMGDLVARCETLSRQGVPNYFGEQRFGSNANNLHAAEAWLVQGARLAKTQKSFAMSAARAYLFNLVLSHRVQNGTWLQCIEGESVIDGGPSGPLWGRGRLPVSELALSMENEAISPMKGWCEGLEHCGLSQERRALVLQPKNMAFEVQGQTLTVQFSLPPGTFATSVLREITGLDNRAQDS